jgi:hypothetical protein
MGVISMIHQLFDIIVLYSFEVGNYPTVISDATQILPREPPYNLTTQVPSAGVVPIMIMVLISQLLTLKQRLLLMAILFLVW